MVRRSLIVAALLAISSPLAAQENDDAYVWSANRPDAHAPLGVAGERTLDLGALEITYKFSQMNSKGVYFMNDSLPLAQVLQLYQVAPLSLSKQTHTVMGAYGVTADLTVLATAEFSVYEREQLTSGGIYYITGAEEIGDVTAKAIYEVYRGGPYRMSISLGGVIPVGKSRTYAQTPFSGTAEEALPYDMRPGGGTFAVLPGISGEVQNEFGSLGAQFEGRINVGEGTTDFTLGDSYLANGWAAYKINDYLSLSAGIRWQIWGNIEGADPQLDPAQDPEADPVFLSGQRADMPLGVNFVIPGDGPLAGHRLFLEAVYAMHHDYEGPQLGLDWGINLGYRAGL
ncbi:MAG: hypothetical protein PVF90_06220 [Gemmatimonadota bacterium]|jgi:hypothetical protein